MELEEFLDGKKTVAERILYDALDIVGENAELLNSSAGTVDFHRNNLRKKLGLINTKTNLRSFLLSLS